MKKIFRNSMLVVMGLLFFACEAEENTQVYSCNESVNDGQNKTCQTSET